MPRTAGILQPGYLPWLGFFEQLARTDIFVVFDDVQFSRKSWRQRNRIRTVDGWAWLSVPVQHTSRSTLIKDVRIAYDTPWQRKHARTLIQHYSSSPHFHEFWPSIEPILMRKWEFLTDLDMALTRVISDAWGIKTSIVRSSELRTEGQGTDKISRICQAVGADLLYDGEEAEGRIDPEVMATAGLASEFQRYLHPVYAQAYPGFVPFLSAIDALFTLGPSASRFASPLDPCRNSFCLASSSLFLRSYTEQHQMQTYRWMQDASLAASIDSEVPSSFSQQQEWFDSRRRRTNAWTLAIESLPAHHVGNLFLDEEGSTAKISLYLGEKRYRGSGMGTLAVGLGLRFAFVHRGLDTVWLTVRPDNHSALSVYERWGFERKGRLGVAPCHFDRYGVPLLYVELTEAGFKARARSLLPAPLAAGPHLNPESGSRNAAPVDFSAPRRAWVGQ